MEKAAVEREWLSYPEAGRLTGLRRTTIWRLVGSGELKVAHVGRARRIERKSLEDFMERRAAQPKLPGFDDIDQ